MVNYIDSDNYVYYQLGKDYLHRTEIVKGKKSRTVKVPHKMKWDDFLSVDITVTADSIVNRVLIDDNWVELDNWKQPGSNFSDRQVRFPHPKPRPDRPKPLRLHTPTLSNRRGQWGRAPPAHQNK